MTRWRPDTCGCELIFKDGPENTPTFVKQCNDHLQDTELTVWDENREKNKSISILMEAGFKEEDITWEFEKKGGGQRLLKIYVPLAGPMIAMASSKVHLFRRSK